MPNAPRPVLVAPLLLCCGVVQAATVGKVEVVGLDEAMTANVRAALSLDDARGKPLSDARLAYLLRVAEDETREALEPFGRYTPDIAISTVPATIDGLAADAPVDVRITVSPGDPVRVRSETVAIEGEAADDRYLKEELDAFAPKVGDVFDHPTYEKSKAFITRRLAERGYFDADFVARRVEVTRAEQAADIDLRWNSGDRYAMGDITFDQGTKPAVRESLLREFVYWKQGDYYHQGRLDRLRKSLDGLDYFSRIDIEPRPEDAVGGEVPVTVRLTPAKRSIYSLGASYGTESGAGVSMGVERRYLNSRGHKALAQLDYAEKRKTLTLQYRVPAFAWRDGWYTGSLQFADEQTDYIDSRRSELVFSRNGQYNRKLNLIASAHVLRERWAYPALADDGGGALAPIQYRYATFTFPALVAEYVDVDDRIAPRRGYGGALTVRGGVEGAGSDANFLQLHLRGSWYRGLGPNDRLILRGELGHTFTNALVDIPPSLRFYAGGDRSVRGYGYREIGPRIETDRGLYSVGAKNVLVASAEYERYFTPTWGAAAFVDAGNAFDGGFDHLRRGVGIGLRWKSPVGPLRIDIGHGLDDPDARFTLHLNLGADL